MAHDERSMEFIDDHQRVKIGNRAMPIYLENLLFSLSTVAMHACKRIQFIKCTNKIYYIYTNSVNMQSRKKQREMKKYQ